MSLISLLIALLSERYLFKKWWQFNTYYKRYSQVFLKPTIVGTRFTHSLIILLFITFPVALCFLILEELGDGFLYLLSSTVILIICFGCFDSRRFYKRYLEAAFQGETTTCDLLHQELLQNKQLPRMGVGQALVWLNYRYFIAIMVFFVLFGAPGALFYRLLTRVNERCVTLVSDNENEKVNDNVDEPKRCFTYNALYIIDWIPVRLIALAYMLVGHFSKAIPTWLENLFDINKPSYEVLTSVAQKSEDFMIDTNDCTAEPCILVRLAKRTLLLCLAIISILILTGIL
jgi:AmpE protein